MSKTALYFLLPFLLIHALVYAEPPPFQGSSQSDPNGEQIARYMQDREEGVALSKRLKMTMLDKRGKKRERSTRIHRKNTDNVKKSVLYFDKPRNVRGIGLLTHDYENKTDNQWLYLPAMGKIRRLSASDRGDYFLGTDFTYEDIKNESKFAYRDFSYKTLGLLRRNNKILYRLELIPINETVRKELGYSRIVSLINKKNWFPEESSYWDLSGNKLKTIVLSDIRQINSIWTAHKIHAKNHKTKHQTIFEYSDVKYLPEIDDQHFNQSSLRRGG